MHGGSKDADIVSPGVIHSEAALVIHDGGMRVIIPAVMYVEESNWSDQTYPVVIEQDTKDGIDGHYFLVRKASPDATPTIVVDGTPQEYGWIDADVLMVSAQT
ncbi:hypothetical protein KC622_02210 [Candidatus Dojkabacteria bacterium]|uniref:Uncharacterized protein n=1 Tax=Candidatus Dojkabacteria bacterium TaxID=2099670 RepID=A0A955KWM0_9BACT|nr:hypothetical protein [Candidatus Dojkabacteria bacterium]MCB9790963.1 hypothetical protein [Candidatus Nomurabacteria bacterium]